jgi:hypothetical protein
VLIMEENAVGNAVESDKRRKNGKIKSIIDGI